MKSEQAKHEHDRSNLRCGFSIAKKYGIAGAGLIYSGRQSG